jgi:hypothetical protein
LFVCFVLYFFSFYFNRLDFAALLVSYPLSHLVGLDLLIRANMSTAGALRACDKLAEKEREEIYGKRKTDDKETIEKEASEKTHLEKAIDLFRTHPCWEKRKKTIEEYLANDTRGKE